MTVLTTEAVNKNIKSKRKFCRQSQTKYFKTFLYFTKFSFHKKRNEAWLLVIKMVYTSCLASCRTRILGT